MHERGLHVDAEQHAEPDQVDAELVRDRRQQRDDDEGQLEEIEKERQQKDHEVDDDQKAELAAGQAGQQVLDPEIAVDAAEGSVKTEAPTRMKITKADSLRRRIHRLTQQRPAQPALRERHDQRAGGAHRAALGRGRDADEDRAEHQKDQRQGRHHHDHDLLRQPAQQMQAEQPVGRAPRDRRRARPDRSAQIGVHVPGQQIRRRATASTTIASSDR